MILGDGVCHLVQQDGLAGPRGRYDETALTFADRRHQIHHAHAQITVLRLETDSLVRIARAEVIERGSVFRFLGIVAVYALDFEQGKVSLPRLGWAHLAANFVAGSESESLDLGW